MGSHDDIHVGRHFLSYNLLGKMGSISMCFSYLPTFSGCNHSNSPVLCIVHA